jgi:hypothetical protein
LTVNGAANFGGTLNLVGSISSSGTAELIGYTSYSGSFSNPIGNLPPNHRLVYNNNELDLLLSFLSSRFNLSTSATLTNIRTAANSGASTIYPAIINTGDPGSDTIDYRGLSALTNGGMVTGTAGSGNALALGSSGTATYTFTSNAAGSYSLSSTISSVLNTNVGGSPTYGGSLGTTVNVYDYASPSLVTSLSFSNVRVGATKNLSVSNNTISNASFQDSLDVTGSLPGGSNLGVSGPVNVTAGGSTSLTYTATMAGSLAATSTVGLTSNANSVPGLSNLALANSSVAISGAAYDYASPSLVTSLSFSNDRVGATKNLSVNNNTISNASFQDSLDVTGSLPAMVAV